MDRLNPRMANPPQETPAYRQPRWLVPCAALGFALLYACGLVVANVFPSKDQKCGWPFVFMVRQSIMPGSLTIMYRPWPLDNTPIVQFRPTLLYLNVLIGSVLTALATIVPIYWLRLRERPFHFSLRSLFVLTTIVACYFAALKCLILGRGVAWPVEAWLMLAYYRLIVARILLIDYFFPISIVLTAAHWLVMRSYAAGRQYRWLGLHWLTWIAVCAVGGPCLHYAIFTDEYGWPLQYYGSISYSAVPLNSSSSAVPRFNWPSLVGDIVVWLAATAATAMVVEGWIRRVQRRIPMRQFAIFAAYFAFAGAFWILNADDSFRLDWYDYYSWFFGLTATFFATQVLTVCHWKAIPKISLLTGIGIGGALWFILSPLLLNDRLAAGLSLVAGAIAAAAVDAGHRVAAHGDRGVVRLVRRDCGEHAAAIPIWAVAIAGIIFGLAMVYTSF